MAAFLKRVRAQADAVGMDDLETRGQGGSGWLGPRQLQGWVGALPVVCLTIAMLESGTERWAWGLAGLLVAAIVLPAVTRDWPLAHRLSQGARIVIGLGLGLGGLLGCAGSIYLFTLGSYAMLASFVLGPVSVVLAFVGGTVLFAGAGAKPESD